MNPDINCYKYYDYNKQSEQYYITQNIYKFFYILYAYNKLDILKNKNYIFTEDDIINMSTQNNISFYENITKNKEIIDMEIFMAKLLNINILFITDKHYLNQNFNKNKNKDEISKITNHFETKFYSPNEKEHYKFKTIILYELKNYNFNYNNFLRKKHFIYYILVHYNDIV